MRFLYSFSQELAAFIFEVTSAYRGNRFLLNIGTLEVTILEIIGSSETLYCTFGDTIMKTEVLDFSELLVSVYQIADCLILENRNIKWIWLTGRESYNKGIAKYFLLGYF